MGRKLLIVESPAKAKTIAKYLGSEFTVKSSVGHIRDLPKDDSALKIIEIGEDEKGKQWNFLPEYVVSEGKEKVVAELKKAAKEADEIYLASDPDREGEAIAWHLHEVLSKSAGNKPFYRVTYNEITKSAVLKAVASPRDINMPLVDAQQARRILDRIVGYKVSPLLWRSVQCPNSRSLSAGRVQSVALRLLVERQREIDSFVPEIYFQMGVEIAKNGDKNSFVAKLARLDGEKPVIRSRQAADAYLMELTGSKLSVSEIRRQPKVRRAQPPFTTSTLQQAASSFLGMSPGRTMATAQKLYEQGLITYMRTDSVNISEQARAMAKDLIVGDFGQEYYPLKANFYKSKADSQGAHEAIRPTDVKLSPENSILDAAAAKLYDLIWRRFVASQMAEAKTEVKTAVLDASRPGIVHNYKFTASATEILFDGFLKVAKSLFKSKPKDAEDEEESDEVASLPELAVGEEVDSKRWISDEKATKGPSHYSEASLIKALEENGVGRPSTYAATIETLKTREYADSEKKKLVPLERGKLVCEYLVSHLDALFSVGYTAIMESELDKIEADDLGMNAMLSGFYNRFNDALCKCTMESAPDGKSVEKLLAMFDSVKTWREPRKVGRRVYDDHDFVNSIHKQALEDKKTLTPKQVQSIVKIVRRYSDQIENVEERLKELGLDAQPQESEKGDSEMINWCFTVAKQIPALEHHRFFKSLHDQYERGRELSLKQLAILAQLIGDSCAKMPNAEEIRARLLPLVPNGFGQSAPADSTTEEMLSMLGKVTKWKEPTKHGKMTYDDKEFYESLTEQFSLRGMLTPRQLSALKRILSVYHDQIPEYDERAEALGLKPVKSATRNEANKSVC